MKNFTDVSISEVGAVIDAAKVRSCNQGGETSPDNPNSALTLDPKGEVAYQLAQAVVPDTSAQDSIVTSIVRKHILRIFLFVAARNESSEEAPELCSHRDQ